MKVGRRPGGARLERLRESTLLYRKLRDDFAAAVAGGERPRVTAEQLQCRARDVAEAAVSFVAQLAVERAEQDREGVAA